MEKVLVDTSIHSECRQKIACLLHLIRKRQNYFQFDYTTCRNVLPGTRTAPRFCPTKPTCGPDNTRLKKVATIRRHRSLPLHYMLLLLFPHRMSPSLRMIFLRTTPHQTHHMYHPPPPPTQIVPTKLLVSSSTTFTPLCGQVTRLDGRDRTTSTTRVALDKKQTRIGIFHQSSVWTFAQTTRHIFGNVFSQ